MVEIASARSRNRAWAEAHRDACPAARRQPNRRVEAAENRGGNRRPAGTSPRTVSGAIFLILEMYTPCSGLVQVSRPPLGSDLAHLGQ